MTRSGVNRSGDSMWWLAASWGGGGEGIDNKQRIVDGSTNVAGCDGWSFISVNVAEVL